MSKNEITATQSEQIAALCQQHNVRRLTWLYKPLRSGPDADSESALLIEFDPTDMPRLAESGIVYDRAD